MPVLSLRDNEFLSFIANIIYPTFLTFNNRDNIRLKLVFFIYPSKVPKYKKSSNVSKNTFDMLSSSNSILFFSILKTAGILGTFDQSYFIKHPFFNSTYYTLKMVFLQI